MDLYNIRMQNELNRKLARLERQSLFEMALIFIALLATMGILFTPAWAYCSRWPSLAVRWQD